jgi:hypothetical protein
VKLLDEREPIAAEKAQIGSANAAALLRIGSAVSR